MLRSNAHRYIHYFTLTLNHPNTFSFTTSFFKFVKLLNAARIEPRQFGL